MIDGRMQEDNSAARHSPYLKETILSF